VTNAALATVGTLKPDLSLYDDLFRARSDRPVFQYPGMMVSPMQGELLDAVLGERGGNSVVFDPFLGSATTLVEAATRGLPFVGRDINPLSILLGHVETAEAASLDLEASIAAVVDRAGRWVGRYAAPTAPWCQKWFRADVALELSALRAAIAEQPDVRERRLFWAAMGEVVRRSGNQLAGAPKLQTRPEAALARRIDVIDSFRAHAHVLAGQLRAREQTYNAAGWFSPNGRPSVDLMCGDVRSLGLPKQKASIVLTSPPYGDNHTTMPYGQVSYLPLRWIDVWDIDPSIDRSLLDASKTLDTASLGGSLRLSHAACAKTLERSSTLRRLRRSMAVAPARGWARTISFFSDLDQALEQICAASTDDAHFVLTLGDKTTYQQAVPTTDIVTELLASYGVVCRDRLERRIGRGKRLAPRNSYSDTIGREVVLVGQRQ
jgi:hypothetical protein